MIQVVIQPLMIPITKTWMKMWEDADDVYEELGEINTSEFKDLFLTLSNNKSGILKQENASNMHHTILNGSGGITTRLNIQFRLGENTRFPLIYEIRIHILRKLPQEKRKLMKTLTTPIRSNEEGIPPGQQVDVEGSLQSPNYTQANSNEEASSGERT
ncbi:unnamed protein product [Rhizophagus irregularis]|nr:unnamed protein product [Rhizophagus irregularis]